jgi:hypothetical protein
MVGLWDQLSLVRAVVREKRILGIFQYHHKPHPKTSLHPSQTSCLNREKKRVRRRVKSIVRNQVGNLVRSRVKSLTPSLSPDQSVSIVSFVERIVTRERFCYKRKREARMAKEWANKDRYHPSHGVPEPRMSLPKGKGVVHTVPTWRDRRASGGGKLAGRGPPAKPVRVTGQTGAR